MGTGALYAKSSKQKLNGKSSTEAELIGVSEYLLYNIWMINFFKAQGYAIVNNILYRDNQSVIRIKKRSKLMHRKLSAHRHSLFFVKDRMKYLSLQKSLQIYQSYIIKQNQRISILLLIHILVELVVICMYLMIHLILKIRLIKLINNYLMLIIIQ